MAAPAAGFPLTLYMHGSGGEWYQGIERGRKDEVENPSPPAPGLGPAYWLAQRGVATLGFDFSLHGNRHSPPDTSGLVLYNITGNPQTTLHNFKVAVMELVFLARVAGSIKVPAALAGGLDAGGAEDGLITINGERLTAMGQSMGSTLGAVWSTVDTQVKGLVFAGAGGLLTEIGTKRSLLKFARCWSCSPVRGESSPTVDHSSMPSRIFGTTWIRSLTCGMWFQNPMRALHRNMF